MTNSAIKFAALWRAATGRLTDRELSIELVANARNVGLSRPKAAQLAEKVTKRFEDEFGRRPDFRDVEAIADSYIMDAMRQKARIRRGDPDMPKKQNTYEVEGKKLRTFAEAAAKAIDIAIQSGESATIVERGATGTYAITVRAESEQIG